MKQPLSPKQRLQLRYSKVCDKIDYWNDRAFELEQELRLMED